jgi:hypothetical protein
MTEVLNAFEGEEQQDPKQVEELLAKADSLDKVPESDLEITPKEPEADSERPEWLPEKFKSAEDMAKAYSELEKKLGSKEEPEQEDTVDQPDDIPSEIDFDRFNSEYNEAGQLSEESYADLEKQGLPRELVDDYIRGQEALKSAMTQTAYDSVGGEDQYKSMIAWAGENLSEAQVDAFNEQINSGDQAKMTLAIQGLNAQYRSAEGSEPKLVQGDTATPAGGVFNSSAELTQAMRDPRYKTDPAYRKMVADKLNRSKIF